MLMRVRERNNEVEILFTGLCGRQHAVLVALSGTGGESAPVFDRSKLESLSVRARADGMKVRLRAKSGEKLDVSQLYRGLRRAIVESGRTGFVAAAV